MKPKPILRKKVVGQNRWLPTRPKRVPSGYMLFIKDYFRKHQDASDVTQGRREMDAAIAEWKGMDSKKKTLFQSRASKKQKKYRQEMIEWNKTKAALKKPNSPYGFFMKQIWDIHKDSGRTILEMNEYASQTWKNLTKDERKPYELVFLDHQKKYLHEMRKVYSGGAINTDWRNSLLVEDHDEAEEDQPVLIHLPPPYPQN